MDRSVFSDSVFAEVNYQQGTISDEGTDCLLFFSFFVVGFFCLYTCFFFCLNTWYTKNDVFSRALMHAVEHHG